MGVIKQSGFVSVMGNAPSSAMVSFRSIDNGEESQSDKAKTNAENSARLIGLEEELSRMRLDCERECETLKNDALSSADAIVSKATETANTILVNAETERENALTIAKEQGFQDGYKKGEGEGYESGYNKARGECNAVLGEITSILERIPLEKEEIFKKYENRLFDLIFKIANKITVNSLSQKDKSVISKMLKEASKEFRGSNYIKVTLSKVDLDESVNVDIDDLLQIFGENQQVDFEIRRDAPKGTLVLDNGKEIIDAGIQTQLKMIEGLGKGRFRDKPEE